MRLLFLTGLAILLPATSGSSEAIATDADFSAVAFFTSGILNDKPIDRIDTATLNQERIVLFVEWSNLKGKKKYPTVVRILDPYGNLLNEGRYTFTPGRDTFFTYYWYKPKPEDPEGDWTFQLSVDGRKAFEARIAVSAAH